MQKTHRRQSRKRKKHNYRQAEYFYKKNAQGDVFAICDINGIEKAKYVYDAWGNHKIFAIENGVSLDITDDLLYNNIGHINPFRYRGYYYDTETKLYYLNSRYYDPELGRFINADDVSILDSTMDEINGINLYSYCMNNPVNNVDSSGNFGLITSIIIGVIIGAVIVGTVVGVVAYQNGARGWDLFGKILIGAILGGTIGGIIGGFLFQFAPAIGSFLKAGFSFTIGCGGSLATTTGMAISQGITITVTGVQVLTGALAAIGS